jgi:hypothetical protein
MDGGKAGWGWRRHARNGLLFQTVKALKKNLFRNGTVREIKTTNDMSMGTPPATKYPLTMPQGGEKS